MIIAKSIRTIVLVQWSFGLVLALIFNKLWPPAAILFCILTMTAPILGFAAPVVNRLNYRNDSYTQVSLMDFILYLVLLTLPPILDTLIPGFLCPYTSVRGVWFVSLMALLFMLPGKWYDWYREFDRRRWNDALESLKKKETIFSILRITFTGGIEQYESMSSRRRWIYIISFCVTSMALMGIMFSVSMAQFVHWLPILAAPIALIGVLAASIAVGVMQLEIIDKIALQNELKTAHDMQMSLMPKEDPKIEGFDISGICLPANEVGGDFFDYVWLDDEKTKLGIAVADVSGKAMKAAITAVMTSGMIYREVGTNETPKNILKKINRPMYLKTDRRVFTALSFAVIDMRDRTLTFSNAGQMTPLLRRGDKLQSINVEGTRLPLGVMEDVEYNEVTLKLQSGDILVLFTDGIVEAKNEKDELWGFERMEEAVMELLQTLTAKEMCETLVKQATEFAGSAKQHDDMTIVVVRVL